MKKYFKPEIEIYSIPMKDLMDVPQGSPCKKDPPAGDGPGDLPPE